MSMSQAEAPAPFGAVAGQTELPEKLEGPRKEFYDPTTVQNLGIVATANESPRPDSKKTRPVHLTVAQEVDLAKRVERGDLEAKEKLIMSNQGLVWKYAHHYRLKSGGRLGSDELAQEGNLGLMRAIKKFDYAVA